MEQADILTTEKGDTSVIRMLAGGAQGGAIFSPAVWLFIDDGDAGSSPSLNTS